ncbi:MAG: hypothetical protein NZL95_07830, partial [Chitinophagales bacterium]|nr:hypothetical protein [Chitinophagales bacterium]MDW8428446.1 hypothetical protein [Chitinophagales bacterium]
PAALAAGAAAGALQGAIVAYLKVPAFIVTLGGLLVFRGWISTIMGGETVPVPEQFQYWGGGFLSSLQGWTLTAVLIIVGSWMLYRTLSLNFTRIWLWLGLSTYVVIIGFFMIIFHLSGRVAERPPITTPIRLPEQSALYHSEWYQQAMKRQAQTVPRGQSVPVPVAIMLLAALAMTFLTSHTVFGRRIYAIGGNAEAAYLSGVNLKRNILLVFALCGLLSAIAGLVYTARLGSATPDAARGYELYAIAACVIGGTSLRGGRGVVVGALLGALIMAALDAGMSIMNIDPFYQDIIKGVVLVGAVYLDMAGRRQT